MVASYRESCVTPEWGTPDNILEALLELWPEGPDLDPASSEVYNQRVKAKKFFTQADNGLEQPWGNVSEPTKVFCNPPGGKLNNRSLMGLFWAKAVGEYRRGRVGELVFMAYSLDLLQVGQNYSEPPTNFPLCIPDRRLAYVDEWGFRRPSNNKPSLLVYLGLNPHLFANAFSHLGAISG